METSEMLAAEAKGLADPHAGHGHRFLKASRFLEEVNHDDHDVHGKEEEEAAGEEKHDHSAGIRVGSWVCIGIFG
jgi:hypothetical protein